MVIKLYSFCEMCLVAFTARNFHSCILLDLIEKQVDAMFPIFYMKEQGGTGISISGLAVFSFSSDKQPEVELLHHTAVLFLIF